MKTSQPGAGQSCSAESLLALWAGSFLLQGCREFSCLCFLKYLVALLTLSWLTHRESQCVCGSQSLLGAWHEEARRGLVSNLSCSFGLISEGKCFSGPLWSVPRIIVSVAALCQYP